MILFCCNMVTFSNSHIISKSKIEEEIASPRNVATDLSDGLVVLKIQVHQHHNDTHVDEVGDEDLPQDTSSEPCLCLVSFKSCQSSKHELDQDIDD